jgi:hypothetical protein
LAKDQLLEFKSFFNTNTGNSNKQTYDYNDISNKHDTYNPLLSNAYKSNYAYTGGGISFRTNQKKLNITAGAQLQFAALKGKDIAHDQNIDQRFTDVLPNAIVQYNISRMKNLRLEYNTFTTQPGIIQLQPVADVSDPLNIVTGNPNLKGNINITYK